MTLACLLKTFWRAAALLLGLHTPTCAAEGGDEYSEPIGLFGAAAEQARATQPAWSSPLVTTTGLMEQRFRFDIDEQHSGNGVNTTALDSGRALDLIVTDNNEVQIGLSPYDIRSQASRIPGITGFADWPFVRIEQRLASSPENQANYVLTAWLQVQAPSGIARLTTGAWTYTPTIAFGKGWGAFDVQGTIAAALPTSHTSTLGYQVQTNLALQYHLLAVLWPELEANWTWFASGQRGGLNQLYLTAGLVAGRFQLTQRLRLTVGAGYQFAVAPAFHGKPLTPAYNDAWLLTSRVNF